MNNNAAYETPLMGATEETAILEVIKNDITVSTTDIAVYMEIIGVDINNKGVNDESTGMGIDNPVGQDTPHEDKNNEY